MLEFEQLGQLHLEQSLRPGLPAHLATASGLVQCGGRLFVVADDEAALCVFERVGDRGRVLVLDASELPLAYAERKAVKPDLESLAVLPPTEPWPHGALATLGSGSTAGRERGWLIELDEHGRPRTPVELSLSPLYARLRDELADLNIEGAAVCDGALWLAQRGNGANGVDALVELSLPLVEAALATDRALQPAAIRGISRWALGEVDDVRLTFSDLAPAPTGRVLFFCAVAERTASTYDDGPCVGAGVGLLDPRSSRITRFETLAEPHKIEGISSLDAPGPRNEVLLVADEDMPESPAPLFRAAF